MFLSLKPFSLRTLGLSLLALLTAVPMWAVSTTIVISQLYTAGGNSGATYNADYIELFNLSGSAVSLSGYALQYESAAGTTGTVIALPAGVTLQPGQRYLIQGTPGTTGAALPSTADATLSGLAMGATAGKIFLTSSTTALASSCTGANIVDFVGYGSTASCYEGAKYAPAPSTTMAGVRTNACTDTDNNGTDFALGTPAPRNSASTPTPCGAAAPSALSLTTSATPNSVYGGSASLLTAVVTPGTQPSSTGIAVTADTSALGGSTTQPLYDDATHGDATANDGTYSFSLTVPSAQAANTYSISVKATDSQLRSASGSASLTVLAPVTFVPIHTIQGNTPGTTPYSGKTVQTSGIVTGVLVNGFYLQAKDAAADTDPATSEGIFVHTGTGNVPATAVLGNELQVSGTVSLYPSTAVTPGTELDTPAGISILSTANPMPSAIALTTTYPTPGGGVYQLLRYQSMRVTASPSFTTTEGTQGTQPSEAAETYVSNGQFYGTVTGVARPTREAGLEVLDPLTASQPSTIARFDDNPELIMVDSDAMVGGSGGPLDVTSNTVLTNMTGVMDFSGGAPLFIVDAAARPTVSGGMSYLAVTPAKAGEITIGDQNMERFYNNVKDTAGAVVLTDAAYALRLAKGSLVVRNVLRSPDILCLEEMENLATLTDLSNKISADAQAAGQTDPKYAPYLIQGNDSSAINVAFLINTSKIDVLDVSQFGKDTTYTNASNTQATLNDRPPLVLHAGIKRAGTTDYPVTVIVNHLRSLNGVTDNTTSGQNVRTKREKQAEFLANLIQGYQTNGEHIVTVGDYNAFDVNDGVVDSLGIIRGAAAPSSQDIIPGPAFNLVSPSLVDAAPTNVASGAYSYVYVGNAQSIDHVLVSQDIAPLIRTSPAHFDADFPQIYRNDATRPEVSSDHDGIVAYLAVPAGTFIGLSPTSLTFATQPLQTTTSQTVTVSNSGSAAISFTSIVTAAPFSQTNTCGTSLAGGAQCVIAVSFKPTATGPVSGTLTLTDSDATTTQTVALSGTGAGVYSTLLLNASPSSTVVGTSVNLIANVGGNGAATPTGNVSFFDGSTLLGSANISGGTATLTTKALAIGAHSITATYNGDTLYPAVTSSVVTVSITAAPVPDFTFSVSNSSLIVSGSNPSSSTTVNVAYVNGFSSPVTFACAGMPTNSRCSFTPATLTATGTSTLTVIINSGSASMAPVRSPFNRNSGTALAFALLSLPLVLRKRHRHTLRAATGVAALLLSVVLLTLTGCGSGGSLNVPKGTTSITVTATGGSISHASTFTLNVQ